MFIFNVGMKQNVVMHGYLINVGDRLSIKAPYMKVSKSGYFVLRMDNIENLGFPDREDNCLRSQVKSWQYDGAHWKPLDINFSSQEYFRQGQLCYEAGFYTDAIK